MNLGRTIGAAALLVSLTLVAAAAPGPGRPIAAAAVPTPPPADLTFFESRVRPLLAARCAACHNGKVAQGGLRLDQPEGILRGGASGPAMAPGKPDESRLIEAVRYANPKLRMPPAGRLPEAELDVLTEWVRRGAPLPRAQAASAASGPLTIQQGRRFWSLRPLAPVAPPRVKRQGWAERPIDPFILARLEARGLGPAPRADARTLIRRAYFDLVGLPPAPEEVEAFVRESASERKTDHGDTETRSPNRGNNGKKGQPVRSYRSPLTAHQPGAYDRLIDRLLASPAYGERWGRHWLDLVRYCDVPEAWARVEAEPWRYRDWVVRSLNADVPYDRFVKLQLAADEIAGTPPADYAALGFLGLSPTYWKELKLAPDVIKTVVAEEWEERIGAVSGTVLGLTAACARCHDHKTDPITQKDYYALAGVFASTKLVARPLLPAAEAGSVIAARRQVADLEAEAKKLRDSAAREKERAGDLGRQAQEVEQRAAALKRETPGFAAPTAYAVETASLQVLPDGPDRTRLEYLDGQGQDIPMQRRGNPANAGSMVERRFLEVLSGPAPPRLGRGSGRADLADAIFREGAPLAARVIVNRVWRHHFGRGLVETPSNFGVTGDRPTHPELLETLAARFVRAGWSLKWLHREIMLSAAYQQSSRVSGSADPENRLLGRMSRRRLEVEAWRDSILAAAGTLDPRPGGAPQELRAPENVRRTLYGVVTRRELDDLLRLYDFPDPVAHSPARFPTTTPLQELFVLNSPFIGRQAAALAARVRKERPDDLTAQVGRAHELLYGRTATPRELDLARSFLRAGAGTPSDAAWSEYAEVLIARNELIFVD